MGFTLPVEVPVESPLMPGPFQIYEVAAGVQLAVNVEEAPALIVAGEAVRVHEGAAKGCTGAGVGVGAELPGGLQVMVVLPFESEIE